MATQLKTFSPVTVATAGSRVPCNSAQITAATVSNVSASAGLVTVTTSGAHGFALGNKIIFYGVGTNTGLNGVHVTVTAVPTSTTFQFQFAGSITNGADSGSCFASPVERYRVIRIEIDQSASTNKIFVGDNNVASSRYTACLTLAGQIAFTLTGEGIDPSDIWLDTNTNSTKAQVSVA